MKSNEIRQKIAEQRKLVEDYKGESVEELRKLTDKIDILNIKLKQAEEEENEERNFKPAKISDNNKDEMRSIVKYIHKVVNNNLTSEDRALVNSTKLGTVLPDTFIAQVKEIRSNLVDLSKYTQNIPVSTRTGSMPISIDSSNVFLTGLNRSSKDSSTEVDVNIDESINWELKTYSNFTPVNSEDNEDDLYSYIQNKVKRDFAVRSALTRTKNVYDILMANKTSVEEENDASIVDELDKIIALTDVMQKDNLVVLVNTITYAYIDSLKDSMGRRLDLIKDGKYLGLYDIVQIPDAIFGRTTKKYGVMVANIYNSVVNFYKRGLTIKVKEDCLATEDKDIIKVSERYDMKKADTKTVRYIEADL